MTNDPVAAGNRPPRTLRIASTLAMAQGIAFLVVAAVMLIRALAGHREETVEISGYGTALWFAIMAAVIIYAGWAMARPASPGRGRGVIMTTEVILLCFAWYLMTSGQYLWAALAAVVAVTTLFFLLHVRTSEWIVGPVKEG